MTPPPVLILSATAGELAPLRASLEEPTGSALAGPSTVVEAVVPWWDVVGGSLAGVDVATASTGIGKVNAAAGAVVALAALRPSHVVLVGIGGAYPGSGLELGEVAVASSEVHIDSGVGHDASWQGLEAMGFPLLATEPPTYNRLELDKRLVRLIGDATGAKPVPFATSEAVTDSLELARAFAARHGVAVESMEGAAVAQVARAYGVPLVELRGVSNVVGVRDKARWRIADAIRNACAAAELAVETLGRAHGEDSRKAAV